MKENDNVNAPAHYTAGGIECIDAIQAALTPEEFRGFCKGNALKYIWRERHKGGNESVEKGEWYMKRLLSAKVGARRIEPTNREMAIARAVREQCAFLTLDPQKFLGIDLAAVIASVETDK